MKIVGLCGGSGSGKGTVAKMFSDYKFESIDTDKVYHMLVSERSTCLDALVAEFGEIILCEDGSLNRKMLAQIVFTGNDSESKRAKLNKISHEYSLMKTREMIKEFEKNGASAVLIDAPLLFESGFDKECDMVIAVIADVEIRISRIKERDGITDDAALSRIRSQLSDEYLKEHSDYIIENSGTRDNTAERVKEIAHAILTK